MFFLAAKTSLIFLFILQLVGAVGISESHARGLPCVERHTLVNAFNLVTPWAKITELEGLQASRYLGIYNTAPPTSSYHAEQIIIIQVSPRSVILLLVGGGQICSRHIIPAHVHQRLMKSLRQRDS